MDPVDLEVRNGTYRLFADLGRAPALEEVADALGMPAAHVEAAWRRLHDGHALVLHAATAELRMANPFSAVPTAHRVRAAGRWWYANCAWDAFGVCAALGTDGRVESSCADCADVISIEVRDGCAADNGVLFHCLVPATHWWDDIGFT